MKDLILLRGLPGSGKSTVADLIGAKGAGYAHFEADMYFMKDWVVPHTIETIIH